MQLQQVNGLGSGTDTVKKIENGSVGFDPYTLPRTVGAVLFSREAY